MAKRRKGSRLRKRSKKSKIKSKIKTRSRKSTIRKRSKIRKIKLNDGMITYDCQIGKLIDDKVESTKNIFKKKVMIDIEIKIVKKIKELQDTDPDYNQNIVKIIDINEDEMFYTIEKLDITGEDSEFQEKIKDDLKKGDASILFKVKQYLQKHGIAYIDWRYRNIGSIGGVFKLYDFDGCGTFEDAKWVINPPVNLLRYIDAVNSGIILPKEIDNFSFGRMKRCL